MRAAIIAGLLVAFLPSVAALADDAAPANPPAATAPADKAARLDKLFADLKAAPSVVDGKLIEQQILGEWLESGDKAIDGLMLQAIEAMNSGTFNVALALLDQIVASKPDYVEGWNKRATVYYEIQAYDKSLADIEKTLQLEPRHFGALAGLGMIMVELGDKERALTAFEKAYAVDPAIDNGATVIEQLKKALGKNI